MSSEKEKKNTFILELKLNTEVYQEHILSTRFEIARKMYNNTLSYAIKQLKLMRESKVYKETLNSYINAKNSDSFNELKEYSKILTDIRMSYDLSEYQLHAYIVKSQHNYIKHIDSNTAQKIATRVWKAISDVLFKEGKHVYFKKYGQMDSVEGKTNASGIMFKYNGINDSYLQWSKGFKIPVSIRKNDIFAYEVLENHKIKYCRVVAKIINGKTKYYVQLVMDGAPPIKVSNSTGNQRHKLQKGKIGIDIGISTVAVCSNESVLLKELAPDILKYDKEIFKLQKRLDRSRRATNPNNYDVDGTIKRGMKLKWIRSKKYIKTLFKLKELHRFKSQYVKVEHNELSNYILSLGNEIYVEEMNFKALAKRAKNTEKNSKGKFKRKKRFGKSISNKSPAKLLGIIDQKLTYQGLKLIKINTRTFKASQYNHATDTFKKKKLNQRWAFIDGHKIQRDLYSAFLIKNSKKDLKTTDRNICLKEFKDFIKYHDKHIEEIINSDVKILSSMGIKRAA